MTTLNKTQTARLRAAIDGGENFMYWIFNDTNVFPLTIYNAFRQNFIDWKSAYDQQQLTLTNHDDTTELADGIDSFPIPPSK